MDYIEEKKKIEELGAKRKEELSKAQQVVQELMNEVLRLEGVWNFLNLKEQEENAKKNPEKSESEAK